MGKVKSMLMAQTMDDFAIEGVPVSTEKCRSCGAPVVGANLCPDCADGGF